MHSLSALSFLALPLVALGAPNFQVGRRQAGVQSRQATTFTLNITYSGADFLEWDFFNQPDPTSGQVNFLDKADAQSKNLAFVDTDGTFVMQVDNTTALGPGENRDSIRISSPQTFTQNLFIADIVKMPVGLTTWPAYWSFGANWPTQGEIDVIEGVNSATTNQMTLHTGPNCTLDTAFDSSMTGTPTGPTDCESPGTDNSGCGITDSSANTFGQAFNVINGGVTAHLVDDTGIKIWRFQRGSIPADITAKNPQPDTWGLPAAFFSTTTCDVKSHFVDHNLVFDTTICGDLAGALFPGGPSACSAAVQDPSNYQFATWRVSYIDVYNFS
ncbi:GH16 domain-containing protein [Mycena chlorophos]|uniref:GH16 domain-containing protein n=1 Tax=Mycena chlorophos TaxID=658473 RepID=A0A8H6TQ70_MYCCL|nr:GH16 domain-containing protein [Mycena chlorophos]